VRKDILFLLNVLALACTSSLTETGSASLKRVKALETRDVTGLFLQTVFVGCRIRDGI